MVILGLTAAIWNKLLKMRLREVNELAARLKLRWGNKVAFRH
jgi:hypothetical protein